MNEFRETDSWRGPTLGGLVESLEAAVVESPDIFLPLLSEFRHAKISFQYAVISGFKSLYQPSNSEKPKFNWAAAWPKLLCFFGELLNDPSFWSPPKAEEKSNGMIPTRSWLTSLIAGLLEAGTKDDNTAYDPALLPYGWGLIKILLREAETEPAELSNPMTHALNTEKGHIVGALYNHALRVCRVSQMSNKNDPKALADAWVDLQSVFDEELAKCIDNNFEFSTLSASYIANLDFMSRDWLSSNVRKLFPVEYQSNFKSAIGGLAFGTPSGPIFRMLASNNILATALKTEFEDPHSRERLVEWICLAFLWGDESLTSPHMRQIFAGGATDIQIGANFFWQLHGDEMKAAQIERVLEFWEASLKWAQSNPGPNDVLLSRLSRLAVYLPTLDARAMALLRPVVAHVHSDYSSDQMIQELSRISDSDPAGTIELLETMFEESTPLFDLENRLKGLLKKLYSQGQQANVLRIIDKLRKTLPDMLPFYKELRDGIA